MEKIRIGFIGMCAGAGATTVAFTAAEYLRAHLKKTGALVTFLELDPKTEVPAGRAYDKIGIDRRFAGREFVSAFKVASEGKPLKNLLNIDGGINWALRSPNAPEPALTAPTIFRLLNNIRGDVVICDIPGYSFFGGTCNRDILMAILADLDMIICIFDPLPSRLLASVPTAEVCRAASSAGVKTQWVFNKFNPGVDLREAVRFTGIRDYLPFPAIPAEMIYKAEYACRSLASIPDAEYFCHDALECILSLQGNKK